MKQPNPQVRNAAQLQHIARLHRNMTNRLPRTRLSIEMLIELRGRQLAIRLPRRNHSTIHGQRISRNPSPDIEVLHRNIVGSRGLLDRRRQSASFLLMTLNRLSTRSSLPRSHIDVLVSTWLHRLSFNTVRIMPHPPLRIFDARDAMEPVVDRIAPHNRMSHLILEERKRLLVSLRINLALQ